MVGPRTPNFRLNETLIVKVDKLDTKVLEAGTYIRPIQLSYVPEHVLKKWPYFFAETDTFAYTKYGIIVIPKHMIEEG